MKALTLWQPWATLVAIGAKQIETRSWSTNYRGDLAIHAAKTTPKWARAHGWIEPYHTELRRAHLHPDRLPSGVILAVVRLDDVQQIKTEQQLQFIREPEASFGDYRTGRYMWLLDDLGHLTEYISATGRQGLWDWEPQVELKYRNC